MKIKEKEKLQVPLYLEHSLGGLGKNGGWEKEGQARPSPNWKRELAGPPLWVSVSWTLSLGLPLPLPDIPSSGVDRVLWLWGLETAPHSSESGCSVFLQLGGWRRVVCPCQSHQRRTTTSLLRAVATWADTPWPRGTL